MRIEVRFMLLDLYGGIYVDGDVLYLKDLLPLRSLTFAYRWSAQNAVNTAVLGLDRSAKEAAQLFALFVRPSNSVGRLVTGLHPRRLSFRLGNALFDDAAPLRVLHVDLFDPAWLCNDGHRPSSQVVCSFHDFSARPATASINVSAFFPGAFTYHMHMSAFTAFSLWSQLDIAQSSPFRLFETHFYSKLNLKPQ